ncbi:acetyl-CoA carboxylase carboxyltransferase subunit alpha [candidate division TA06 bacterium]|nr:acetyl-CoA carboxylase carboxyltransferase subunit alpha [candidate division TA06 bacterium]
MAEIWLDFERPIVELERHIEELRIIGTQGEFEVKEEIERLEKKAVKLRKEVYTNLTPWQRVQLSRHPRRPYTLDYIKEITDEFVELHGDRYFGDDAAIVAGLGRMGGRSLIIIGHQKGRSTSEKVERNFGMPHPEGYRKALRVMQMAAKFGKPILSLVDTPGAYPGIGAEERGQAEAIARNLREISILPVPIIVVITGEGGSGGALAIAVGDRVFMMQYAIYSVISPEGCASILWRDAAKASEAAEALKLTARDLLKFGIIDGIIEEPVGGAHRNPGEAARRVKEVVLNSLEDLNPHSPEELVRRRIEKFSKMGVYKE